MKNNHGVHRVSDEYVGRVDIAHPSNDAHTKATVAALHKAKR
ncbi:MAG: hypothetical protein WBB99_05445 [Rhodococcus sp. (in: high G+C Gram-positive bacteria)]